MKQSEGDGKILQQADEIMITRIYRDKTREILMTTLFTLRKRKAGDVMTNFKAVLDELARDPRQNPYQILFSPNSS